MTEDAPTLNPAGTICGFARTQSSHIDARRKPTTLVLSLTHKSTTSQRGGSDVLDGGLGVVVSD
jgi:hypothetical protein